MFGFRSFGGGMFGAGTAVDPTGGAGGGDPTVTSVQISPSSPSVAGGDTQQFTAIVLGTNSPPQDVTWTKVSGVGSINSTGLYTAPAGTSSAQTATVRATSVLDPTKSATTTITVAAIGSPTVTSVTISPSSPTIPGGGTQQFTAAVIGTNSPSQEVTWTKVSGAGTFSSSGMFTAPATSSVAQSATIRATSVLDPSKSITTTITIPAEVVDPGEIVYPPPSTVLLGTMYGPTGVEYTGTLVPSSPAPTVAEIAAAVWAYETALSIPNYMGLK